MVSSDMSKYGLHPSDALDRVMDAVDSVPAYMTRTPAEVAASIDDATPILEGPALAPTGEPLSPPLYNKVTYSLARGMLTVFEESRGMEIAAEPLMNRLRERWPDYDTWAGGAPTRFMVGYAVNMIRYVLGMEPIENPALPAPGLLLIGEFGKEPVGFRLIFRANKPKTEMDA